MILSLFRRSANNRAVVERLYARVVEASRQPRLYLRLGVPDTFEGRFESLSLHAVLVLRRLQGCEAPGPEVGQDLVDMVFHYFDRTLREMGVGDTSVPKRMKTMAQAFLGRSAAYGEAIDAGGGALATALSRNVYNGAADGVALASYAEEVMRRLDDAPLRAFIEGTVEMTPASLTRENG